MSRSHNIVRCDAVIGRARRRAVYSVPHGAVVMIPRRERRALRAAGLVTSPVISLGLWAAVAAAVAAAFRLL